MNRKLLLLGLLLVSSSLYADAANQAGDRQADVFAKVGDDIITTEQYNVTLNRTMRQRFYHSRPPEGEVEALRKEVADLVINRVLLLNEAKRLGLTPDETTIKSTLDSYDKRYAGSEHWLSNRESMLASLRKNMEEENLLAQLEKRVKQVAPPGQRQVKEYYLANPEKFTEPMQQRISLILLVVDPSSPKGSWEAALQEGKILVNKLKTGVDFAELARTHSGDSSAENGGDMGYLHREMLSPAAQKVVDELKPGEISEAVRLLEGVAILRLDDRKLARLRDFLSVRERARGLLVRELSEKAWADLKSQLRRDTPVTEINEDLLTVNDV